jgi:hypothetical protein
MSYPTSRRYARSLSEAFADERACAIEIYRRPRVQWWLGVALAVAIGIVFGAVLVAFVTPDRPGAPVVAQGARSR